MSGDRARLLMLFVAILLVLVIIAIAGGCQGDKVVTVPTTVRPMDPPARTGDQTVPARPPAPPQPVETMPGDLQSRAVVSTVETVIVLGDATRDAPGIVEPPNSTVIETTVVTSVVPDPALCHAEHGNAVAVSDAIRNHFPSGAWSTMCRIAWCESRFNPSARNPSGATGIFQIMPFWFKQVPDANPYSITGSARLARHVYNEQGFQAWSCY